MRHHHGLSVSQSRSSTDVLRSDNSSSARYPVSSLELSEFEEVGDLVWLFTLSVSVKPSGKNSALWGVLEDILTGIKNILRHLAWSEWRQQQCPVLADILESRNLRVDEVCKIAQRSVKVVNYINLASFEGVRNIGMWIAQSFDLAVLIAYVNGKYVIHQLPFPQRQCTKSSSFSPKTFPPRSSLKKLGSENPKAKYR
jgi:hypothetical protein